MPLSHKLGIALSAVAGINGIARTSTMHIGDVSVLGEFTQDFNSYTPGVSLATLPDWTVPVGVFKTAAPGVIWSDYASAYGLAGYTPPGFVTGTNYETEVTIGPFLAGTGAGTYAGVAAAVQPDASSYTTMIDSSGNFYFARWIGGSGAGFDSIYVINASWPAGTKMRLRVTGTGALRVATASYNMGAGWVTPPLWLSRDFGSGGRYDAGKAGLIGYNNAHQIEMDSLTVRTLPTTFPEVTQDFNGYTAGVSLATLPGWTVPVGAFITKAVGGVTANGGAHISMAIYEPTGFVTGVNHEAEVTLQGATGAGSAWQGVAVAIQPDGSHYWCVMDNNGSVYFGYSNAGTIGEYVSVAVGSSLPAGTKLRVVIGGAGVNRVVTAAYNIGAGWVYPANFSVKFTTKLDGGKCGIAGYGNTQLVLIDSLTIRNTP